MGKLIFDEIAQKALDLMQDSSKHIFLTGKGVTIFNRNGKQIGHITVPEEWTANVCFGGSDMKSLFITATTGLYRMKMQVAGADR